MGQKVNPISLRLEQTNRHFDSCWFNDYNYTYLLNRDIKVQSYINSILKQIKYSSARFFIQNLPNKIKINVFFINPKNSRKTSSKAFQLRESLSTSKVTGNGKKYRQNRTAQLNLTKKRLFLKQYKKQTINKAKVLNYLLLNLTQFSQDKLQTSLSPCRSRQVLCKHKTLFKALNLGNGQRIEKKSSISVREVSSQKTGVLNHFKSVSEKTLSNSTSTEINGTINKKKTKVFLRYLLLKNFSLKSGFNFQTEQARSFLFSNLINFKLLNHNNKFALISHSFSQKIYNHKNYLQENNLKNNLKFSKVYFESTNKALPLQQTSISKLNNLPTAPDALPAFITNEVCNLAIASGKQAKLVNLALSERGNAQEAFTRCPDGNGKGESENFIISTLAKLQTSFVMKPGRATGAYNLARVLGKQASILNPTLSENKTAKIESNDKALASHMDKSLDEQGLIHNLIRFQKNMKLNSKTFNLLDILYSENGTSVSSFPNKANKQSLNKDYIFSSLINNESLKKTHNNYGLMFKNFSNFSKKPLQEPFSKEITSMGKGEKLDLFPVQTLSSQKDFNNSETFTDALPCPARATNKVFKLENKKTKLVSALESYKINKTKVLFLCNSPYKTHLESQLSNFCFSDVVLSFFRLSNEKQSAIFLAEEIIYYLEKRVPFFKIKNQILREASKSSFVRGLRITCSGRVGGRSKKAQRSKVQIIKYGQTSLHVFSSKIDFASKPAHTAFGLLGIKVWICYN